MEGFVFWSHFTHLNNLSYCYRAVIFTELFIDEIYEKKSFRRILNVQIGACRIYIRITRLWNRGKKYLLSNNTELFKISNSKISARQPSWSNFLGLSNFLRHFGPFILLPWILQHFEEISNQGNNSGFINHSDILYVLEKQLINAGPWTTSKENLCE